MAGTVARADCPSTFMPLPFKWEYSQTHHTPSNYILIFSSVKPDCVLILSDFFLTFAHTPQTAQHVF